MSERPICPADHPHAATSTCYIRHRCSCFQCRVANAKRAADRRAEIAAGTYIRGLADATPVREHVRLLMDYGATVRLIATHTRISRSVLEKLMWSPMQKITARYADRILALDTDIIYRNDTGRVDARGARRRVQALACRGWSMTAIANHAGMSVYVVDDVAQRPKISASTAKAIADVYEQLWNEEPDQSTPIKASMVRRTKARAEREGWVPPMGWDDIDTDPEPQAPEPDTGIDVVAVDLAIAGQRPSLLTREERHQVVRVLHKHGHFDSVIAAACGVTTKTIERDRQELGLPGIPQDGRNTREVTAA